MSILMFIYVVMVVMLAFGASIFFHELGHYWVARKAGMKVEEFAVGFGPKIYGFTRNGIDYSLRWIPAGGYVKLPQMITSEALEGGAKEPVPPASPGQKILVALAGPFMNVVLAFVIATVIYFVGLPVAVNPSIIGYVEPNSPEAKMGIMEGDKIVSVDGHVTQSWQDVDLYTFLARTTVLPVTVEHNGLQKTYDLATSTDNAMGLKMLNLDPRDHPKILSVMSGGSAAQAGLKPNDIIVSFVGVPIASSDQFVGLIRQRGAMPSQIQVSRDTKNIMLSITPTLEPGTKIGRIGVTLGTSAMETYVVQKPGPTPWAQVHDVLIKTVETISALVHSHETGIGVQDLSGPVGILSLLAVQARIDYRLALSFMILLNINLAIINLLPIPVLDGGHILMSIIEKIRRRPLSLKFVEVVTSGFAALLFGFIIYITVYGDIIKRFPLYRAMFQDHVQVEQSGQQPADSTPAK